MGECIPIFMGDVPDYSVIAEHMHIKWRTLEIVLPVTVMLAGMASASEEIAKWKLDGLDKGSVVQFTPKRK